MGKRFQNLASKTGSGAAGLEARLGWKL